MLEQETKLTTEQTKEPSSKIHIHDGYWTVASVKLDSLSLYVFGDNNIGKGRGGQAIIRNLPNTVGIPTKKYPNNYVSSFYTDEDYDDNIQRINAAVDTIIERSVNYKRVILPADGLGTGLAMLAQKASKTNEYLLQAIERLKISV